MLLRRCFWSGLDLPYSMRNCSAEFLGRSSLFLPRTDLCFPYGDETKCHLAFANVSENTTVSDRLCTRTRKRVPTPLCCGTLSPGERSHGKPPVCTPSHHCKKSLVFAQNGFSCKNQAMSRLSQNNINKSRFYCSNLLQSVSPA